LLYDKPKIKSDELKIKNISALVQSKVLKNDEIHEIEKSVEEKNFTINEDFVTDPFLDTETKTEEIPIANEASVIENKNTLTNDSNLNQYVGDVSIKKLINTDVKYYYSLYYYFVV
jgi:hypothetical protein